MPAKAPPFDLHEAEQTLQSAKDANRDAQAKGVSPPYGAGALLLVMQRRVREALAAAERRRDGGGDRLTPAAAPSRSLRLRDRPIG